MLDAHAANNVNFVALLAEGVDRNPLHSWSLTTARSSPSSRRAWIEIWSHILQVGIGDVALLAEGVDRNQNGGSIVNVAKVALLAEGVDRNRTQTR